MHSKIFPKLFISKYSTEHCLLTLNIPSEILEDLLTKYGATKNEKNELLIENNKVKDIENLFAEIKIQILNEDSESLVSPIKKPKFEHQHYPENIIEYVKSNKVYKIKLPINRYMFSQLANLSKFLITNDYWVMNEKQFHDLQESCNIKNFKLIQKDN